MEYIKPLTDISDDISDQIAWIGGLLMEKKDLYQYCY